MGLAVIFNLVVQMLVLENALRHLGDTIVDVG